MTTRSRLLRQALGTTVLACLALAGPARSEEAGTRKLYTVGVSHLDTQWYFNIQETIREHIPETFAGTFELFGKYPALRFSWEGAYRYMLLEEYHPGLFDELKGWVAKGRWAPGGSSLEAGDVNVPSPESLVRHFLIGTRYFREKLGRTSLDVFLPDCFGFGYALPAVAAHCGLKGFSTQKLYWQSQVDIPFGIGVWRGVDGSELVAALKPRGYTDPVDHDLSQDQALLDNCSATFPQDDLQVGFTYYGVGDEGGPVENKDAKWVQASVDGDGPIQVESAFSDQLFRDLTDAQVASLPRYDGELLLSTHGTGSYTSQGALKRWNRANELLADATERASVLGDWLGGLEYPAEALHRNWIRFLAQHFHDVLPGTSTADVYLFAWNDELIALNRSASLLTDAVGALAVGLDTLVGGAPLVVYNPLGFERTDLVQAVVRYPGAAPGQVAVLDPEDAEVPSQEVARGEGWVEVAFVARVDAVGLAVYDVRPAQAPCSLETGLKAAGRVLESPAYRVELDDAGDLAAIQDKGTGRALLSAPVRLALWDNNSTVWPAWELMWKDLKNPPREHVGGPAEVRVAETGPARATLEVTRGNGASRYVQRVSLAAGPAGDRVTVENRFDWQTRSSLLKAVFPLAPANPRATYDLGLGTIQRGNNSERAYEVPAQQWADLTSPDGGFGVTVVSDSKYGWDKPDDGTLRLTLANTPLEWEFSTVRYGQHTQDLGPHVTTFALHGHAGSWQGKAWPVAARVNQPLLAFQAQRAQGWSGRRQAPVHLSGGDVALKALKRAEDGDGYVVRLAEMSGTAQPGVALAFGEGIASAEELNGVEDPLGPAVLTDGALRIDFAPYQLRTLRIRPAKASTAPGGPASRVVPLDFNLDAVSTDDARGDGVMGQGELGRAVSIPGEQLPGSLVDGGIRFQLGSHAAGQPNAVECRGQVVTLPPTRPGDRLFLLAAAQGDQACTFTVGDRETTVSVPGFTGLIGNWVGRVRTDKPLDGTVDFIIQDAADFLPPFYKQERLAWYTTHRHLAGGDDPYEFTYLFRHELPVPEGADRVTLPDRPACRVFAMTLSDAPSTRVAAASRLFDEFDPLARAIDWGVMNAVVPEQPVADPGPEEAPEVAEADGEDGWAAGAGGCSAAPGAGTGHAGRALLLATLAALALSGKRRRLWIAWSPLPLALMLAACSGEGGDPADAAADEAEVMADAPAPLDGILPDATEAELAAPLCSARAHGATGDGVTLDTEALQAAIDACAGTGGAVVLEAGTYLSGSLRLQGRMTLHLDQGATLLGSPRQADYPLGHLLFSQGAEDLVIEGPGTIDGNGKPWWLLHSINSDGFRPHPMIRLVDGRRVTVRDLTLKDSPGWHLHLLALDDVTVERVVIRAPVEPTDLSPNTDGIDIDACRHVEIAHCDVETGDDAIVVKNGDASWARESYDIDVHHCTVAAWANGFKIGTRPRAPVHGVTFRDSLVRASVGKQAGTRVMGGVTLVSDDGSEVYDVSAVNLRMTAVQAPFFLRVQERLLDDEDGRRTQAGRLHGVLLKDLTVDDATLPGMIMGIPGHPVEDVTLENLSITSSVAGTAADALVRPPERNLEYPDAVYFGTLPAFGVYARHVAGPLTFAPTVALIPAAGEQRPAVVLDDVAQTDTAGLAPGTSVTTVTP